MPSSWVHIAPHGSSSTALIPAAAAGGSKPLAAEELLRAMRSAPQIKGQLPTSRQLPHTTFSVNPKNPCEGAVVFLHPNTPGRAVGYCFLKTNNQEAMTEIVAKYQAYEACTEDTYPPGTAPLERMPVEVLRKIVENLWRVEGLWEIDRDVRNLSAVSRTVRAQLLDAQKVTEVRNRSVASSSCPADQINEELAAIASYALSDEPVALANESLLAAFKHYVQAFVEAHENSRNAVLTHTFIDTSVRFMERMRSDDNVAKALSLLGACPVSVFNAFLGEISVESAEKLIGIVTRMKNADAKAESIAALGNLLRLSGLNDRRRIQYVKPLLEQAESLNIGSEARDKIGRAFLYVRKHLASYCTLHYDTSHFRYAWIRHGDEDNEENRKADLETGRKLDAFLARHNFLSQSEITPLWETEPA